MGAPDGVDVFPIKNGDIPASYVALPGVVLERIGEKGTPSKWPFTPWRL